MAADDKQLLDLKDLYAVLARAKAEGWTELALLGPHHNYLRRGLIRQRWPASRIFGLDWELDHLPPAIFAIDSLTSLNLTAALIADAGAKELTKFTGLTSLDLTLNQIGDAGAEAVARLSGLTLLSLSSNEIGDAGAKAIARLSGLTSLSLSSNEIGDAGAKAIARLSGLTSLDLSQNEVGNAGAEAIARLSGLTSLNLSANQIGDAGAQAIASLSGLTLLNLGGNQIGDAGAKTIASLSGLTSLDLTLNQIGDAGAEAIASLSGLTLLNLGGNQIGDTGAEALARLSGLTSLDLSLNRIGDAGAEAIASLTGVSSLIFRDNRIGDAGVRAILDAWADPATADRRRFLALSNNGDLDKLLPAEVLQQTNAQVIIAAWRQRKEQEPGQVLLPGPGAAGVPVAHGVQVGLAADGRLTLVDPALGMGARDDAIGRELHGEVIAALDRLIGEVGQSNVVAEWREAAEAGKERLGGRPREVRVSAILRFERLRSLREADERRRAEPDPLVEPAEAGVAAALRDAVAAANLYVETDPYLAEQQRRLTDPNVEPVLSVEEAEAAEADLEVLDIAEDALLGELRHGRETAAAGGEAGRRARVWLAGSWRNVLVEVLRRVLAGVREQARAARASADNVALQAKLGTVITLGEARAVLARIMHQGWRA